MDNPWTRIPFEDYEGHMSDPSVQQLNPLGEITRELLEQTLPETFVLLGCCTGNGLEHVDPLVTKTVCCVDINKLYLEVVAERFSHRLPGLQLYCADLDREVPQIPKGNLVMAALLFEYVDPRGLMQTICGMLAPEGVVHIVLQQNSQGDFVSKTPYRSLQPLMQFSRTVDASEVIDLAKESQLNLIDQKELQLTEKKKFIRLSFSWSP